jgi:CRP-like cAMP-binding protein
MPDQNNALLSRLDPEILKLIEPYISVVELQRGDVLASPYQPIEKVYFPHSGIVSCAVTLKSGASIETGLIGRDGEFGAGHSFDDKVSLNLVQMQVGGAASVLSSGRLLKLAEDFPSLRRLLFNYEQVFLAQVQQTAACNAVHSVQERTCKWLLRMYDLTGPDLNLTQDFLAQMMGVRRTSVTDVAMALQQSRTITYSRGQLHIVDVEGLKHLACECNEELRSQRHRLLGS